MNLQNKHLTVEKKIILGSLNINIRFTSFQNKFNKKPNLQESVYCSDISYNKQCASG